MKGDSLIGASKVALRYGVTPRHLSRLVKKRDGSVAAPCREHPYRWRVSDVDAHIAGLSVVEQRQQRAKQAQNGATL